MSECVAALGFFDGVHLGHGALLRRTAELASEYGCESAAVTFDRHPASVISGGTEELLTAPADRVYLMQSLYGIDRVEFLHFGKTLMHMPREAFLDAFFSDARVVHVVCGWDYRFGSRGEGNAEFLREYCKAHSIGCDVIPELRYDEKPVHSSLIRDLIRSGHLEEAEALLGHACLFSGKVLSARQLGAGETYATHLLPLPHHLLLPPAGVYLGTADYAGNSYPALIHLGAGKDTAELRMPEFPDVRGEADMRISLKHYLRSETEFGDDAALKRAITTDEAALTQVKA